MTGQGDATRPFDPDRPIDSAVDPADEELPFALTTPAAPRVAPPEELQTATSASGTDRTTEAVIRDHLRIRMGGSVEDDLPRNYAIDLVTLDCAGVRRGWDGLRHHADRLSRQLPDARFTYRAVVFDGRMGFLAWSAEAANGNRVEDGADSYLVENGRIIAQTIHYTVRDASGDPVPLEEEGT